MKYNDPLGQKKLGWRDYLIIGVAFLSVAFEAKRHWEK